ncbi:uncharacterized protein LOC130447090 [Diorhabda sublineata]|uniref:uncharacterized protein LOC130447090 n=1 Tax=Diorhabda sublineata TaxID=1163346 RepID=UPI0024E0514F|nr:uncharacterized protein LOC130447090 [Diorhabda sublineata]
MILDTKELPFFPKYQIEQYYNKNLWIIWFEAKFSQSHYNIQNTNRGSNACTLIVILFAGKCNKYDILLTNPVNSMVHLFAISMLEGNKIHDTLKQKNILKHVNLNVPEAISYGGSDISDIIEWKCLVFMEQLSKSLYKNIKSNWKQWLRADTRRRNNNLYVVLVADSRTVLFIIQFKTKTVVLIDSHLHSYTKGAFMAFTDISKLNYLCYWYSDILRKFYNSTPQLYELSFLYFLPYNN